MKSKTIKLLFIIAIILACSKNDDNTEDSNSSDDNFVEIVLPNITDYPIVDTNQSTFFGFDTEISIPSSEQDYFGQDAQYNGNQPSYTDNGNGTITDNVTGLMWQKSFDHNNDGIIDVDDKLSYSQLLELVEEGVSFSGYNDWRLPTIKEQYSLIMFSGKDISGYNETTTDDLIPFIDTNYFEFEYGDTEAGERLIDMQCA
ncbi:MAG: DUF1566 domain-containing protein, partial [Bacteroidia bacterium]|nr:DUF1566 domain-containing protein [Bacteroidia bacterium]